MNYQEALKEAKAAKPKENYCVVQLNYNTKYVLPHKDGVALLATLSTAEQLEDSYGNRNGIHGIEESHFKLTLLSPQQYQRYKIAALLNISLDDLEKFEKEAA